MKKINPHLASPLRERDKIWFSLIELIIVISIIAIISVFWASSFSDQIDSLKFKNTLWKISWDLKDLDNKINNREIFDYEVVFEKNKNYFLINENIFDLDNKLELTWITSWIWNLEIKNWDSSSSGAIKFYSWYKFIKQDVKNWDESFTWTILKNKSYKFSWTYSWAILNNLYLNNFWNNLKLIKIDPNIWPDLNKINIKNILWKKQFWNIDSINKVILTFEDNLGKSETLEIKK